jgi:hypothetical protein
MQKGILFIMLWNAVIQNHKFNSIENSTYCDSKVGTYVSKDEQSVLKIFCDTTINFGNNYYCSIETIKNNVNGYFNCNCKLDSNEILIYNPNVFLNQQKLTIASNKNHKKRNKDQIVLNSNSNNLPYYVLIENKMVYIEKSKIAIDVFSDTLDVEFYFKGCFSGKKELVKNKIYRLDISKDISSLPILKWLSSSSLITRGYFSNDSIIFPGFDGNIIYKKMK